jgi:hypothetical protein
MSRSDAPRLEPRTPGDIAAQLRRCLDAPAAGDDRLLDALIGVFAGFAGKLVDGLNAAPQRRFEAFVELLRAARYPAQPARTVLVFRPVPRGGTQAPATTVRAGTAVGGPVPAGAREPLVFETVADLALSTRRLARAFIADEARARWTDAAALATPQGVRGDVMAAAEAIPWALQLALPAGLPLRPGSSLRVAVELDGGLELPPGDALEWFLRGEQGAVVVTPSVDGSEGLRHGGELVFSGLPDWPPTLLAGRLARWIGCRRVRKATASADATDSAPAPRRVLLQAVQAQVRTEVADRPLEAAFCGGAPLDLSRDLLPLGERPRFGDSVVFQSEAFCLPGAQVQLALRVGNAAAGPGPAPLPRVAAAHGPGLRWDVLGPAGWRPILDVDDDTAGLTRSGRARLTLPADIVPAVFQGRSGGFLRAWLATGDYLPESEADPAAGPAQAAQALLEASQPRPPLIAPPSVAAVVESPGVPVAAVVLERGLATALHERPAGAHGGFELDLGWTAGAPAQAPVLYLGFERDMPARASERLQLVLEDVADGPGRWQYRNPLGWSDLAAAPVAAAAPREAAVALDIGGDWAPWPASTVDPALYWLRRVGAVPGHVLVNAVPAQQLQTVRDEVLGSSSGRPAQVFPLGHRGVLGEPVLEVCETGAMPAAERQVLVEELGADAVRVEAAVGHLPERTWVRWRCVPHFDAAGPASRVYTLDPLDGRVCFGDGRHGRIPPPGANNLVARHYRCGGGAAGNVPPGSLALRGAMAYVDGVSQPLPASGGQDAESPAAARAAATAALRHRGRAVGPEDYEDLARRASPQLVRALCLPARDVGEDPLGDRWRPGCVSVVLLPGGLDDPAPGVDAALRERVGAFLALRSAAGARIVVGAPLYARIDTEIEVDAQPGVDAAGLARACEQRIQAFLHPASGGVDGGGWPFARLPHVSELRAALRGLATVRQLSRRAAEPAPGALRAPHLLVCAGRCAVHVALR